MVTLGTSWKIKENPSKKLKNVPRARESNLCCFAKHRGVFSRGGLSYPYRGIDR